ncbi:MAG: NADP oxidoreductase [Nitrospirae bacterium RBG_19FT_COMBO_55_12]|jgi:NADP-reducing hydrogenase subunit HndB|nr:MAG: NADP oxidoreductase [Nitrospirae bacterium RBG_19FT_COMBO_55_12]
MAKLKIEDLKKIKENYKATQTLREGGFRVKVTVHMGTCGIAAGARGIMDTLLEEMNKADLKDLSITTSGCAGLCSKEPMATVELVGEPPVRYISLTADKMRKIFAEHVVAGRPVKEYALVAGHETTY